MCLDDNTGITYIGPRTDEPSPAKDTKRPPPKKKPPSSGKKN